MDGLELKMVFLLFASYGNGVDEKISHFRGSFSSKEKLKEYISSPRNKELLSDPFWNFEKHPHASWKVVESIVDSGTMTIYWID